jgi:hypothetical protein
MLDPKASDDVPPGWSASEFARYREYMRENWLPPPDIGQSWAATPSGTNGHAAPGVGHNRPPADGDTKKARFIAELVVWADKAQRVREAIRREDLAKHPKRPGILRLAHLHGTIRYYRAHPKADVAPGLYSLIVILSDNDEFGACYLSVTRMAKIFGRMPDCIREALGRLADERLIGIKDREGETNLIWPLAHPSFAEAASPHWLVDAFAPPSLPRGRPRKPLPLVEEPFSEKPLPLEPEGFSGKPLWLDPEGLKKPLPLEPGKPLPLQLETTQLMDDATKQRGADVPPLPLDAPVTQNTNGSVGARPQPGSPSSPPPSPRVDRSSQPLDRSAARKGRAGAAAAADAGVEQAIEAYNEAARQHGFTAYHSRTPEVMARLQRRLAEIGGVEPFKRALSAIPRDDFLMGRVRQDGRRPYRLDMVGLLRTKDSKGELRDVLAKLIDDALAESIPSTCNGGRRPQFVDMSGDLHGSRRFLAHAGVGPGKPWPAIGPQSNYHPTALSELGISATEGST